MVSGEWWVQITNGCGGPFLWDGSRWNWICSKSLKSLKRSHSTEKWTFRDGLRKHRRSDLRIAGQL